MEDVSELALPLRRGVVLLRVAETPDFVALDPATGQIPQLRGPGSQRQLRKVADQFENRAFRDAGDSGGRPDADAQGAAGEAQDDVSEAQEAPESP